MITVLEVRERQTQYDITYMSNLKYDTSELIYKTENRLKGLRKQAYGYQRGSGERSFGLTTLYINSIKYIYTTIYKIDNP